MSAQPQPCLMSRQMDSAHSVGLFVNDKPQRTERAASGGVGPGLVYCLVSKCHILNPTVPPSPQPLCKFHRVKRAILVENEEENKSVLFSVVGLMGSCVSLSLSSLSPKYLCRAQLPPSTSLIKELNS